MKPNTPTGFGVIFDYDGVVSDSLRTAHLGVSNVFVMCGIAPPTYTEFLRTFKAPYLDSYQEWGITASRERISEWYHEAAKHDETQLFNDVEDTVKHLTCVHNAYLGIITAQREAIVVEQCEAANLKKLLGFLAPITENKVPAIQKFCEMNQLKPEDVWFIGDFSSDIRDGKIAGVHTVGITRGNPTRDILANAGAEILITNLSEFPESICCPNRISIKKDLPSPLNPEEIIHPVGFGQVPQKRSARTHGWGR